MKKIYVTHSSNFDFKSNLYDPLRASSLNKEFELILPHEKMDEPFNSRKLFDDGCDLILAEVSFPSTGQGIELGWANAIKIPIICIYKRKSKISGGLKVITKNFIEYETSQDLIKKLKEKLANFENE